ncbi:MAG: hypothetical protein HRF43_11445, partial [Phycisphaerae bacterium]
MAVNEAGRGTSAVRRLFLGANVTLAVVLVVFIVVAVNFLANRYNQHKDVSGGLTGYRLSDRTQRVLAKAGPITVTTVYTSNDPDKNFKDYLPKLRDFCDELERASKQVRVEHISSPDEQAALRDRVSRKFGSATAKHRESTEKALALWGQLKGVLDAQRQALEALAGGDSWLRSFSSLATRTNELTRLAKNLEETEKEVKDLIEGEALPKYSDASSKITSFDDDAKRQIEEYRNWARDMDKLARTLGDPNLEFVKKTQANNQQITAMMAQLREIIGDAKDQAVPEEPAPVLQKYGATAKALADVLYDQSGLLQEFLKANPAVRYHNRWSVSVDLSAQGLPLRTVMGMDALLSQTAEQVAQWAQVLRQGLRQDAAKDRLQGLVRQLRSQTAEWAEFLRFWAEASTAPFAQAGRIDEASKKLLADVSAGEMFKDILKEMEAIATTIKELPQQKMNEVGERLKQDNIVVVESDKEVRILPFDEVWPLTDRHAERFSSFDNRDSRERHRREFNGDAAICSAMMDMQSEKKLATVILTSYESQPPPQMRQFQRPMTGPIPMEEMSRLKEALERANFAVKEWSLAAPQSGPQDQSGPKPVPDPPAPEADTEPIYVFLPPAEQPPMNPFMPMPPSGGFGEQELAKVKEVLSRPKTKAIFLAVANTRFAGQPEATYGYNKLLEEEWGIRVDVNARVVRGVPSAREPGMFTLDPIQLNHLRLNTFSDQPIGKPLRSRRMLTLMACPVNKVKSVADVVVSEVLTVPGNVKDVWAEGDLGLMVKAIRERTKGGVFSKSEKAVNPPFPVILAAENTKNESKIVVMGNGGSF